VSPSGTTSATQELINVIGNNCYSNGSSGINISNSSSGSVVQYCVISGNTCSSNTSHGILLTGNVTNNRVAQNICKSNTSNGIRLSSQTVNIPDSNVIEGNTVASNGTQIGESGDTNTILRNNKGFNPQGMASISVGASPYTYTAGFTREIIYISGGTVSAITKSSTTLFTQSNVSVILEPSEAVTVTYSVTPTMNKDRR
jgi:parallel beta-helix repeat protein